MIGIIKLVFRNMNQNAFQERKPPQWMYEQLAVTGGEDRACYEASLYSLLNVFLTSYFGMDQNFMDQNFMVKLQPKIWLEFIGNSEDVPFWPSLDSYHAEVLPWSFGVFEALLRSLDFIVIKATASQDNNCLLLVIEIKCYDRSPSHYLITV